MTKIDQNLEERVALLSVYDKNGIVEFAKDLIHQNFKIYASGGTFKTLSAAGVEASDVADLVGGGPILGHRVVTLSREIYAGLLSRDVDEDKDELEKLKIPRIDLVCVDLYPLSQEISESANQRISQQEARERVLEKTDIGGPTLLRAAAKGRRIVVSDAADRPKVIDWLKNGEPDREVLIAGLAAKAEYTVANYALTSARYHSAGEYDGLLGQEILETKYGENAWQVPAGLFSNLTPTLSSRLRQGYDGQAPGEGETQKDHLVLSKFEVVAGTTPSYNNLADVDRLLQTITHIAAGFDVNFGSVPHLAIGVKHGNPCGAAAILRQAQGAGGPASVIKKMLEGDLRAIFGGLVMVNFEIDEKLAEVLLTHRMESGRRLLDGIAAPAFTQSALEMLKRKGDKCRFLVNSALASLSKTSLDQHPRFRYVRGGFLRQPDYNFVLDLKHPNIVINTPPQSPPNLGGEAMRDIILAWAIGSTSNSNTVTIVKDGQLLGNGVGQQDRVSCCELAIKRAKDAGHDLTSATAYSDSFFPFPDGPLKLIEAGIKTIFATSGSVKDEDIKKVCADHQVTFVTLPDSEARGFFGH